MIITSAPQRTSDPFGSGAWQASRGSRKHNGIDYACLPGSTLLSSTVGMVTKIGWPYSPLDSDKGHFRYVEVTTPLDYKIRYFYVEPSIVLGQRLNKGDSIGIVQDLTTVYKGITPHVHVGVKKDGKYINPEIYLREVS